MGKLTENIVLSRTKANDISMVRKLNCWGCHLDDISLLERMPAVEVMSLSVNDITDLSPLQNCKLLTRLYLRRNDITDINQLSYLEGMTELVTLWLDENPIANHPEYRNIIMNTIPSLKILDDKPISFFGNEPEQPIRAHEANTSENSKSHKFFVELSSGTDPAALPDTQNKCDDSVSSIPQVPSLAETSKIKGSETFRKSPNWTHSSSNASNIVEEQFGQSRFLLRSPIGVAKPYMTESNLLTESFLTANNHAISDRESLLDDDEISNTVEYVGSELYGRLTQDSRQSLNGVVVDHLDQSSMLEGFSGNTIHNLSPRPISHSELSLEILEESNNKNNNHNRQFEVDPDFGSNLRYSRSPTRSVSQFPENIDQRKIDNSYRSIKIRPDPNLMSKSQYGELSRDHFTAANDYVSPMNHVSRGYFAPVDNHNAGERRPHRIVRARSGITPSRSKFVAEYSDNEPSYDRLARNKIQGLNDRRGRFLERPQILRIPKQDIDYEPVGYTRSHPIYQAVSREPSLSKRYDLDVKNCGADMEPYYTIPYMKTRVNHSNGHRLPLTRPTRRTPRTKYKTEPQYMANQQSVPPLLNGVLTSTQPTGQPRILGVIVSLLEELDDQALNIVIHQCKQRLAASLAGGRSADRETLNSHSYRQDHHNDCSSKHDRSDSLNDQSNGSLHHPSGEDVKNEPPRAMSSVSPDNYNDSTSNNDNSAEQKQNEDIVNNNVHSDSGQNFGPSSS